MLVVYGLVYTEMASSKAIFHNDQKTRRLLNTNGEKSPISMQIFGSDEETMGYATNYVSKIADMVDINMGCPAPKVVKNGDGSKLLFNDGIKGANPSIGSSTPTQANSIVSVNGDVTFNNKVESVSLSVNGGILTLNELNNTYLPIDETKKAPVPILENVDLTLNSGTLNMQNGVIDTLNIRHFNAANPNGEVKTCT